MAHLYGLICYSLVFIDFYNFLEVLDQIHLFCEKEERGVRKGGKGKGGKGKGGKGKGGKEKGGKGKDEKGEDKKH